MLLKWNILVDRPAGMTPLTAKYFYSRESGWTCPASPRGARLTYLPPTIVWIDRLSLDWIGWHIEGPQHCAWGLFVDASDTGPKVLKKIKIGTVMWPIEDFPLIFKEKFLYLMPYEPVRCLVEHQTWKMHFFNVSEYQEKWCCLGYSETLQVFFGHLIELRPKTWKIVGQLAHSSVFNCFFFEKLELFRTIYLLFRCYKLTQLSSWLWNLAH